MATTTPPAISGLPAAPDPNDRSTFNTRAYPWSAALPTLSTEISAVAANVKANADDAKVNADIAVAQVPLATAQVALATAQAGLSQQAAVSAGAIAWVSGTTYAVGALRYSPIDFQSYRRKTAGAGTTDPSEDGAGWSPMAIVDYQEFLTSGTWTKPPGAMFVYVEAIGGGASGRSHTASLVNNIGGKGGAFNSATFTASSASASVAVTVGSGGLGNSSNTFNHGGQSSFGSLVIAPGTAVTPFGGGYNAGAGGGGTSSAESSMKAGAGGGGTNSSGVAIAPGASIEAGSGGAAGTPINTNGTNGGIPGGGGGSAGGTGISGSGGSGRVRVWAW